MKYIEFAVELDRELYDSPQPLVSAFEEFLETRQVPASVGNIKGAEEHRFSVAVFLPDWEDYLRSALHFYGLRIVNRREIEC